MDKHKEFRIQNNWIVVSIAMACDFPPLWYDETHEDKWYYLFTINYMTTKKKAWAIRITVLPFSVIIGLPFLIKN